MFKLDLEKAEEPEIILPTSAGSLKTQEFQKNIYFYFIARASLIAQLVKKLPECRRPWFDSWVMKIPWRRDRVPIPIFLDFPCCSAGKESACNVEGLCLTPGLGRSPGEGGYPLQYSCLENPMDRGACWAIVYRIAKTWI